MPATPAALLLLTDGRLPAGGYAHSGGVEASVQAGRVYDRASLEEFLRGRAATSGAVAAAFAAAACHATAAGDLARLTELEAELDARMPSPALRSASRALGRQLQRAMRTIRPAPQLDALGRHPHQPIAMGVVAAVFDLDARDAATAALYDSVAGPAAAAVRLISLDPLDVHAVLADLLADLDVLAGVAAGHAGTAPAELPAHAAPLLDIAAEHHTRQEARLFAS
ncbi:urease accessory protein UreF [Mycolicibacter sinensis]|uniref:Urease accessory protein UreF n=1 Tax=Mycolicibacter sinensis (strain JDM601) TaxID=875328 RepID=A0A1A3U4N5_MYCSD|nr:urease accessory UreF family protein [Mycolicibacter sinensis]OBK89844.1 urease accessory protein UreF [Mycolicibacter sinensis]